MLFAAEINTVSVSASLFAKPNNVFIELRARVRVRVKLTLTELLNLSVC